VLTIVLAALSAAVWGTADYAGGKASRRADALAVTVVSQIVGLPLLVLCVVLVPGVPTGVDLAWGALAGVAGLGGIVLLYRALSGGAMSVVAPITAVTAALVPIGVGLVTDHVPGALALTGAGCAILAIALVSLGPGGGGEVHPRLVGLALTAGALFGIFFALLGQTSPDTGMWSLVGVRTTSVGVGVALMLRRGLSFRLGTGSARPPTPWIVLAGTFDIAANALYIASAARGHLSIVAAIASLYPASTVLLALAVDRERLRPVQVAGLGLAATALVLATA
jgi:drug/metabolite transporter (DMT)-like permease